MPTLTFKVTAADARAIKARARAANGTVSTYLRSLALPAAKPAARKVRMEPHPISGALYNAAGHDGPLVTFAEIKEALADFP